MKLRGDLVLGVFSQTQVVPIPSGALRRLSRAQYFSSLDVSCDPSGSTSERPSDTGDCITTTDITSGVDTADSPEEMCSVFDEDLIWRKEHPILWSTTD